MRVQLPLAATLRCVGSVDGRNPQTKQRQEIKTGSG
jgi:hypothetical protein